MIILFTSISLKKTRISFRRFFDEPSILFLLKTVYLKWSIFWWKSTIFVLSLFFELFSTIFERLIFWLVCSIYFWSIYCCFIYDRFSLGVLLFCSVFVWFASSYFCCFFNRVSLINIRNSNFLFIFCNYFFVHLFMFDVDFRFMPFFKKRK